MSPDEEGVGIQSFKPSWTQRKAVGSRVSYMRCSPPPPAPTPGNYDQGAPATGAGASCIAETRFSPDTFSPRLEGRTTLQSIFQSQEVARRAGLGWVAELNTWYCQTASWALCEPEAEINICLWQGNELVSFRVLQTLSPKEPGVAVAIWLCASRTSRL